jgi:hypothetical protein
MADVTSGARTSFRHGIEQAKELLRQVRRAEGTEEFDGLVTQCAAHLCAIAPQSGEDRDSSLPQLLSRLGIGLAREGRIHMWACVLARFLQEASARRDLHAIRASTTAVELAASQPSLEAIFQRFAAPQPPSVEGLIELLKILPATSLAAATRLAIQSMPDFLLEPVKEFCRESSAHHCEGLLELVGDANPAVACFALDVVAGTDDDRIPRLATVALRHAEPAVRIAASRMLGAQVSEAGTKLLLERLDRRFKTPLAPDEEVELYRALVATGRHDAMSRVEERLVGARRSFGARLKSLLRPTPDDPVAKAVIRELATNPTPQARDLLQRATKSAGPVVAKACRDALAGKSPSQ